MKRYGVLSMIVILFFVFLAACGDEGEGVAQEQKNEGEEAPLMIYTTVYVWEEFTKKIGGDEVIVKNLVPEGSDVHTFEPTAQTMIDVAESDAFLFNGAGMEGFADEVQRVAEQEGVTTISVAEGLDLHAEKSHQEEEHHEDDHHEHEHQEESHEEEHHEQSHEEAHDHGSVDPHIWLDPVLAEQAAEKIAKELTALRPDKESEFNRNFTALKSDLEELHSNFEEMVSEAEKDTFVVSHAGYGYWEDRYGLHQIGINNLSSSEPSQKQVKEIIDTIHDHGINHIMLEENVSAKTAEVIQQEVGAEALILYNLASITKEERENGEDYFSLMNKNITHLEKALK